MWGYGAMSWLGFICMILFWGLVVLAIVALVRWLTRGETGRRAATEESALEILKRRYAKGEIDQAEFEEKKRHLTE
jgi:putative membrane protein